MSLFKKLTTTGLEAATDTTGGNFQVFDSKVYPAKVKMAYLDVWGSGANYVALTLSIDGKDYSENVTITNKAGENFYTKDDKRFPLPGFVTIDDICVIALGKGLAEMDDETEEKTVKVYNKDAKAELPQVKQVLVGLIGKEIAVAIQRSTETVMDKDAQGKYTIPTGKTRDANSLEKVFEPNTMMTVVEALAGKEVGEFHKVWSDKNEGNTRDKTFKGTTPVKSTGAPQATGTAPAAAAGGRKPLFGNKG